MGRAAAGAAPHMQRCCLRTRVRGAHLSNTALFALLGEPRAWSCSTWVAEPRGWQAFVMGFWGLCSRLSAIVGLGTPVWALCARLQGRVVGICRLKCSGIAHNTRGRGRLAPALSICACSTVADKRLPASGEACQPCRSSSSCQALSAPVTRQLQTQNLLPWGTSIAQTACHAGVCVPEAAEERDTFCDRLQGRLAAVQPQAVASLQQVVLRKGSAAGGQAAAGSQEKRRLLHEHGHGDSHNTTEGSTPAGGAPASVAGTGVAVQHGSGGAGGSAYIPAPVSNLNPSDVAGTWGHSPSPVALPVNPPSEPVRTPAGSPAGAAGGSPGAHSCDATSSKHLSCMLVPAPVLAPRLAQPGLAVKQRCCMRINADVEVMT